MNKILIVNGILRRDDKVLLVHRNPDRPFFPDCWSLPGGHVETNETLAKALFRELKEELGIEITAPKPLQSVQHTDPNGASVQFNPFLIEDWLGHIHLRDDEHTDLVWLPLDGTQDFAHVQPDGFQQVLAGLQSPQSDEPPTSPAGSTKLIS